MSDANSIQVFIKLLNNKTLTLQFPPHQTLTPDSIKHHIQTLTLIPTQSQKLTLNGKFLSNPTPIPSQTLHLSTIYLTFSLLGGKGGFGSLLRGAATKAGQKKTNNFDACRDMSGRRLRHVNAEKKLEEWKAEQEERKLEKVAEDYLKKMVKKGKGGKKEEGAEKYVQKYREDSARCVEEVEKSVRESVGAMLAGGKKRKVMEKLKGKEEGVDAKKLKIWMGKRKMGESDADTSDDDEESDDSDTENEKSIVINSGNQSDSSKDGSRGSVSVQKSNGEHRDGGSSNSGSDEEKVNTTGGSSASRATIGCNNHENGGGPVNVSRDAEENTMNQREESSVSAEMVTTTAEIVAELDASEPNSSNGQLLTTSSLKDHDGPKLSTEVPEGHGASESKSDSSENGTTQNSNVSEPLSFDDYNSGAELEVLGMERLKSELQSHGLKCGGTLQERAARLFLLKTTPVEKLPKKLLAKK